MESGATGYDRAFQLVASVQVEEEVVDTAPDPRPRGLSTARAQIDRVMQTAQELPQGPLAIDRVAPATLEAGLTEVDQESLQIGAPGARQALQQTRGTAHAGR